MKWQINFWRRCLRIGNYVIVIIGNCISSFARFFGDTGKTGNEIIFSKNFITNFFEIGLLIIINGNKNDAVIGEEVPCEKETRVYHGAPVGVEAGIAVIVFCELLVSFFVEELCLGGVVFFIHTEFVFVYEVVARIVGRVDVNHFHFAEVGLLEEFQCVQIIAFNVKILRGVPAFAGGVTGRKVLRMGRAASAIAARLPTQVKR